MQFLLMLATIDANRKIPRYSQVTQCQQQKLSNNYTNPPLQILLQGAHSTLDTTSWPTANNMAPLPSNTQPKRIKLDQSDNYLEYNKPYKTSTLILNYHKAYEKNTPSDTSILCITIRLISYILSPSWLQDFTNYGTTESNQHQLEHNQLKQSIHNITQSLLIHQECSKHLHRCTKILQSSISTTSKLSTLNLMSFQLEISNAIYHRNQRKLFSEPQRHYQLLANKATKHIY